MPDLLLLEDDAALADGLQYSLARSGFAVTPARTLAQARACLAAGRFDLLILDVTLPDGTGFALCEELRRRGSRVPILFLTASDEEVSVIRGLDSGGDDYLTKPFRLGELCSRIRALLRRAGQQAAGPGLLRCGELTIDLYGSRALLRGQPLELTAAEYRLLCLLVRNAGRTVTRGGDPGRAVGRRGQLCGRQHPVGLCAPPARKGGGRPVPAAASCHGAGLWLPVEGGCAMTPAHILRDRTLRRFAVFLALIAAALPAAALAFSLLAQHTAQAMLLERDGAVASALLAQGMAENDIAAALAASEVSGAGRALLARIGRTAATPGLLLPELAGVPAGRSACGAGGGRAAGRFAAGRRAGLCAGAGGPAGRRRAAAAPLCRGGFFRPGCPAMPKAP